MNALALRRWARGALCAAGMVVCSACATDNPHSRSGEVGRAVGSTLRGVGEGAKAVGSEVGEVAGRAGRGIGHSVRDAAVTVGSGAASIGRGIGETVREESQGLVRGLRGEPEPPPVAAPVTDAVPPLVPPAAR